MSIRMIFPWLLSVLLLGMPLGAFADAYSDGVTAYKAKNYARAATLMQGALKSQPQNPDVVFYLGMAYSHLKRYEEARQAFEMVIQLVPSGHALHAKATNNIAWLTRQQITLASSSAKANQVLATSLSKSSKANYLTHVIPNGKIVHFAADKMPLRVYITDGSGIPGWQPGMKEAVIYAMQRWQSGSGRRISFAQTPNADNADIIVRWQKNFSHNVLGVSPFQTVGDTIIRSDITLAVYYPDSKIPIPLDELKGIALHEMGHAIGIKGHSPYPEDIMYFSKTSPNAGLSQRDINTIAMLYKLDADVQNHTGTSTAMTKKYYEYYELGLKAQTGNRAADAIAYYRQCLKISNTLPDAKFNLGALLINEARKLYEQSNLNGAKRNLEEAVRLYSELAGSADPPRSTRENLDIAKKNLAIVQEDLKSQ